MEKTGKVKVSVIVPVYNVRQYVERCIAAIRRQTLRDIEVICVDDGSTDGSGEVLDSLVAADPRFRVIHQSNAGAGVARNTGLAAARGEYVFFFDPDDSCSRHTLKGMYSRAVKTHADIVIAGKCVVDAESGRIRAKYGFHRNIWALRQPFSGRDMADYVFTLAKSVPWDKLFRRAFVEENGLRFQNTRRSNDVFFVDMALALAERIALVPRAYYRYSMDRMGSLQSAKDKTPLVFLDAYDALEEGLRRRGLFQWCGRCFARVLWRTALFNMRAYRERANLDLCYARVRATMLRLRKEVDLSSDEMLPASAVSLYRVMLEEESPDRLASAIARRSLGADMDDAEHPAAGGSGLKRALRRMAPMRILRCVVPIPLREFVKLVRVRLLGNRVRRTFNQDAVSDIQRRTGLLTVDFIRMTGDGIRLEMSYYMMGGVPPESLPGSPRMAYDCGGLRETFDIKSDAECVCMLDGPGGGGNARRFVCDVRLRSGMPGRITLDFAGGEPRLSLKDAKFGLYAPLTTKRGNSYFRDSGWIVRRDGDGLQVMPDTPSARASCRLSLMLRSVTRPSMPAFKAMLLTVAARTLRALRRRPLWLFSDRPDMADDNGRALFEYACSERRGADAPIYVFAIGRSSPQFAELSKVGRCVDMHGIWYKLLFLSADMIISAYRTPMQRRPFPKSTAEHLKWFFAFRYRFVFLKHGVGKDGMAAQQGRHHINARIMVASSEGEYAQNISPAYGYTAREVKLCGLPRYDRLYDSPQNCVVFMPTWRSYLMQGAGTNRLDEAASFSSSAFCRCYRAVLGDDAFVERCSSLGYSVKLMMHPNMVAVLDDLRLSPKVEAVYPGFRYRDMFAAANLMVTDYSSVAFDVAYLKKPVLYYQFDEDEFFGRQYCRGFFDYRRDGFGEVLTDAESLKAAILSYLDGDCKMKPEYVKRVDDFFAFTDKNNCRRVYDAIQEAAREAK